MGFPDIKLLQPLADALGITLVELMQSRRIQEDLPKETAAALVSETVDTLKKQKAVSGKRKLLLYAGEILIIGAVVFLIWVKNAFDFPDWVGFLLHVCATCGGCWGIWALRCIVTGEAVEAVRVEWTWKCWLAVAVSVLGFGLALYVMRWGYDGVIRRDVGAIVGILLMLGGGVGCIVQLRETCDE